MITCKCVVHFVYRRNLWKKYFLLLLLAVVTLVSVKMYWLIATKNLLSNEVKEKPQIRNQKLILYWNAPEDWFDTFGSCPYTNCKFTRSKDDFQYSDAVLFHASYDAKDYVFTSVPAKIPGQVWVYLSLEPPRYRPSFKRFRNVINWTVTYRRDADIFLPYHKVVLKDKPRPQQSARSPDLKLKSVAWFVSNCKTSSKREKFVRLLKQYIDVDIYGKCGELKCQRIGTNHSVCLNMLTRDYKFYLSLENTNCRDYITEKPFHVMNETVIPILWKGYNSSIFLPPYSYIDATEYTSVNKLADYMKMLSVNTEKYNKYFKWKSYYTLTDRCKDTLCTLCKRLNNADKNKRLYDDIDRWVNGDETNRMCDKNTEIPKT